MILAWQATTIFVGFQVIAEVKNTGNAPLGLAPTQSTYAILDASGDVTMTAAFPYAFPEVLAPGETGYLIEDSLADGVALSDFATVRTEDHYAQAAGPIASFEVGGIVWRRGFSGGMTAGGAVTVIAPGPNVSLAAVAVMCLGADGIPLGVTTTYLVQDLTAGVAKDFRTVTESPPLRASQCATTVGYAEPLGT